MSGGLFGLTTLADRTAQAGLGSPPGRKGKDGVSIFDAFQTAGSASFTLVLSDGRKREIFLPQGAPGLNGITPTFTQGTIQTVASGGTGNFALAPTATPGLYSYNVTLVAGPASWAFPVAYAAGIAATPGPPATQVTFNKSTWICRVPHTTTATFDPDKWICVAMGGVDGNGSFNGPATATDGGIPVFDGAGNRLRDSGAVFGTGPGNAIRLDPTSGKLPAVDGSQLLNLPIMGSRYSRIAILTTSQTWTAPGAIRGRVTVIGGGGSGGYVSAGSTFVAATGGGAGGMAVKTFSAPAGTPFTATVGAGGPGGNTVNGKSNGTAGGASSFVGGDLSLTANGGAGGLSASGPSGTALTVAGALGGTASGGDLNYTGGGSGSASVEAGLTNANVVATGGGAVAYFGTPFASGNAQLTGTGGVASMCATGGAGIGGKSSDVTIASGSTSYLASGGGSAFGASPAPAPAAGSANGAPDVNGTFGNAYSGSGTPTYPAVYFQLFALTGRGGRGAYNGTNGTQGDPGCGGGATAYPSGNALYPGAGGIFGGSGSAAGLNCSAYGSSGSYGGGGAAAALFNGNTTNYTASSGPGGAGVVIIEYDMV